VSRVAVTGAAGYVGGRLVPQLAAEGWDVVPLTRAPAPWLPDATTVDLLTDPPAALDAALADSDVLVHLAGHDEVAAAREPERSLLETIAMSHRVAAAAARVGIGRVVHLSTIHVYGEQLRPGAVVTEDLLPAPRSGYAIARLASEHVLAAGLAHAELVVLRLSNSVGAPAHPAVDRWSLLVNDLCRQAAREGRLVLQTPGLQHRDWVSLGDVVGAIATTCRGAVPAGTYNLASGRSATVRDVAELVAGAWAATTGQVIGVEAPNAEGPPADPYRIDTSRLAGHGVRLETPLSDAIAEVTSFCQRNRDELEAGS